MPRPDVMKHMLEENLSIVVVKRVKTSNKWRHCFIADSITESCYISNRTSEISYVFPLYKYPDKDSIDLFSHLQTDKEPNISRNILEKIHQYISPSLSPETILHYIYGILFSNIYRETYFEFLKIDLPKIPFTANSKTFNSISGLGKRLIDLHLLNSSELNSTSVKYQGYDEDHIITRPTYDASKQRVYINKTHYFEGVTPEVWDYHIGGYQVLHKYLKDRKGRPMDNPRHYIHIATALAKTIEIQAEIDELYPEVEKNVIEF